MIAILLGIGTAGHGFLVSDGPPKEQGFRKRMIALEFAKDQQRVMALANDAAGDHTVDLLKALHQDSTIVIPIYWTFFILLHAFLFGQKLFDNKLWLLPVPIIISIAALADLYENLSLESALSMKDGASEIYFAAMVKWICIAIVCNFVGFGLLRSRAHFAGVAGISYIVAFFSIAFLSMYHPGWTDYGMGLMGIAWVFTGVTIPWILDMRVSRP